MSRRHTAKSGGASSLGFRNVVVHDYPGIRVERIGLIVREDVPKLKEQILAILVAIGDKQG